MPIKLRIFEMMAREGIHTRVKLAGLPPWRVGEYVKGNVKRIDLETLENCARRCIASLGTYLSITLTNPPRPSSAYKKPPPCPTEHCPSCRALRNLRVSTTQRTIPDKAGKAKTVLTRTFHCQTCQSFVRSEEEEEVKMAG